MVRIVLDFELRSHVSVVDVGPQIYAAHPTTQILCVAWSVKEASGWSPVWVAVKEGGSEGRAAVERKTVEKGQIIRSWADFEANMKRATVFVAHNSEFEEAVIEHRLPHLYDPQAKWSCTAARSRRLGIPGGLEGAARVMRTPHQKSMAGHMAMMQVAQPRPMWKSRGEGSEYFDDAERLSANCVYCGADTLAERDLDDVLPELPAFEEEVWKQIKRGNRRGLCLDRALLEAMGPLVAGEDERVLSELRRHLGDVDLFLKSPAKVRDFCAGRGVHLVDLKKETVEATLSAHRSGNRVIDELVVMVLEGRQIVGKSSNAKVPAMLGRLKENGFASDYAIYHGAHTGRQTGAAVNPLNLPKPYKGYEQDQVIPAILNGARQFFVYPKDKPPVSISPSVAVSASLRGTIIAPKGKQLVIGDYKTIEPCVLFTLAAQWDAVEIIRQGGDIYCSAASDYYRRPITKADKFERDLWKSIILACGYQMGFPRFLDRLALDGVAIEESEARRAYDAYRDRFSKVCGTLVPGRSYRTGGLWQGIDEAAKSAIRTPHQRYAFGVISYIYDGHWLVADLPSGHNFFYPNARLEPGKYNQELVYDGRTFGGGWGAVRTFSGHMVENLCQAISRDITMEDKLECERRYGWHVPLDVYDEIVAEADEDDDQALEKLYAVMCRPRPWLPEVPISAEGYTAFRYRKD